MENKKRLIDANKLIDFIDVGHLRHPGELCWSELDVANLLLHAPTVDAVEVVRCKECIRRYDTDECPMCYLIEGKYHEYTNENGFCDRGERKEGADNG